MSIKDGDRLPHRRISTYFNVKINRIITTKNISPPFGNTSHFGYILSRKVKILFYDFGFLRPRSSESVSFLGFHFADTF